MLTENAHAMRRNITMDYIHPALTLAFTETEAVHTESLNSNRRA
jgi:hypothetical protein